MIALHHKITNSFPYFYDLDREGIERGGREGGREGEREGREKGGEGEGEREGGREGYNDIHNITAFIKHSIDLKGFSHMLSYHLLSLPFLSLSLSLLSFLSHSLLLQVKLYYAPVGQSDIIVLDPDIDIIMELDGNIKIQV